MRYYYYAKPGYFGQYILALHDQHNTVIMIRKFRAKHDDGILDLSDKTFKRCINFDGDTKIDPEIEDYHTIMSTYYEEYKKIQTKSHKKKNPRTTFGHDTIMRKT